MSSAVKSRMPPAVVNRKAHMSAKLVGSVLQIIEKLKLGNSLSADPMKRPQLVKKSRTRRMKHMEENDRHLLLVQSGSAGHMQFTMVLPPNVALLRI
jgi:hypothetical protein